MKRLLILLTMIPALAFTQLPDTCFTKQEIQDISYTLDSLYRLAEINDSIIKAQEKMILYQLKTTCTKFSEKQYELNFFLLFFILIFAPDF